MSLFDYIRPDYAEWTIALRSPGLPNTRLEEWTLGRPADRPRVAVATYGHLLEHGEVMLWTGPWLDLAKAEFTDPSAWPPLVVGVLRWLAHDQPAASAEKR